MPPRELHQLVTERRADILRVAAAHGASRVRLFGSVARQQSRSDSDIDLLVELQPGRSLLDLIAIKQELEDLLGQTVDVVTEAAVSPYFREQVLSEAVAL
jgi:predicted nucleotidyltransferase